MNVILDARKLKGVVTALNTMSDEAKLNFSDEEVSARIVDKANICMAIVNIPKNAFNTYDVDEDKNIGIDVNRIYDLFKSIKNDELIELKLDDGKTHIKAAEIRYTINNIDPGAIRKEPKLPNLDLPAKIVLDPKQFQKAVNTVGKVDRSIWFESYEQGFSIKAYGDVDEIASVFEDAELIEFNQGEAASMFTLEYIKEMLKITQYCDSVEIHLGNNYPVKAVYRLENIEITFVLAPRIEGAE